MYIEKYSMLPDRLDSQIKLIDTSLVMCSLTCACRGPLFANIMPCTEFWPGKKTVSLTLDPMDIFFIGVASTSVEGGSMHREPACPSPHSSSVSQAESYRA